MRIKFLVILIVASAFIISNSPVIKADLDCGMPPGTPIEWSKDFPKPTPTPRGKVPAVTDGYKQKKEKPDDVHGKAHRTGVLENPVEPPKMDFSVQNLYSYFDILTQDIMTHLQVSIPKIYRVPESRGEDDQTRPVITGKGVPKRAPGAAAWKIKWNYQPEYPTELVWDAVTCCLRLIMHPEIISFPEIEAHLLELGVPAGIGCSAIPKPVKQPRQPRQPGQPVQPRQPNVPGGNQKPANNAGAFALMGRIANLVGELPEKTPSIPSVTPRTQMNKMLGKLAALELTGGYPAMMDPNYARHILSLGEEGLPAMIGCAKSSHIFLKRNAVSALANYRDEKALKLLMTYVNHKDPVVKVRAIRGLMQYKTKSTIKYFKSLLKNSDPMMKALACYGLGSYKDENTLKMLTSAFNSALKGNNRDFMFSLLPAIVRCATESAKSKNDAKLLRSAAKRFRSAFPGPNEKDAGGEVPAQQDPKRPNTTIMGQRASSPEKIGYKNVILWQMTQLALAAMGESDGIKNVLGMLKKQDISSAFHKAVWFLAVDALARIPDDKGVEELKKIATDMVVAESVSVWAVKRLGEKQINPNWFKEIATAHYRPTVKAQAVISLSQKSGTIAKQTCQELIEKFHSAPSQGGEAFFYTAVLQIGGQLSAFKPETLLKVCESAFSARAYAKRQGNNDPDITQADISVYPPLLETSILELGRTGDKRACELFIRILEAGLPNGSPEAALALGVFKKKSAAAALLKTLEESKDGWARFCAYKALKLMTGKDEFCDWIFGTEKKRADSVDFYKSWYESTFK